MQHGPDNRNRLINLDEDTRYRKASSQDGYSIGVYDRSRYGSGYMATDQNRRAKRCFPRWLVGVLIAITAVLVLVGGYTLWFTSQLDRALSSDEDTLANIDDALVPIDASKPFYVLLLGSDNREGGYSPSPIEQAGYERSDVIILVRIDASNKKVTFVSVPRDTPYQLEDGTYVKINEMFNREGAAGAVKAVSEVTGVPIGHFAAVGFSDLEDVVDMLGGVEVNVDVELSYWDVHTSEQVTLQPGTQTLTGQQAQIFARARNEYASFDGTVDMHRQNNVRTLLFAIIKKTLDRPLYEIPGVVLEEASHVTTDARTTDLVGLAMVYGSGSDMTVYSATGPYEGEVAEEAGGLWLCYRNPEGWSRLMAVVDSGGNPSGIDYSETQVPW